MLKHVGILLAGLFATSMAFAAETAETPAAAHEAGKNYFVIDPPQSTATGDKVEVLEVFSYACPHCAHFQPYAEQIKKSLPAGAVFNYMPASSIRRGSRTRAPITRPNRSAFST